MAPQIRSRLVQAIPPSQIHSDVVKWLYFKFISASDVPRHVKYQYYMHDFKFCYGPRNDFIRDIQIISPEGSYPPWVAPHFSRHLTWGHEFTIKLKTGLLSQKFLSSNLTAVPSLLATATQVFAKACCDSTDKYITVLSRISNSYLKI